MKDKNTGKRILMSALCCTALLIAGTVIFRLYARPKPENIENNTSGRDTEGLTPEPKMPEHALVHLYAGTDENHFTTGSGFIMEITEQKIYICTNRHVIQDYDSWEIYFWDGTSALGKKLGASEQYDVGVVEIELEELSEEQAIQLTAVSISSASPKPQCDIWVRRITDEGLSDELIEGKLISPLADFPWGNGYPQTEVDILLTPGDSGSAIFDADGNLISMVYGTSHEEGKPRRWGIPLNAIITCYEEITCRTPVSSTIDF